MKSGDLTLVPADELSLDEQALSEPAEPAAHDDEFRAQQHRIERLNEYYNDVVAELRALLDEVHDEAS